MNKLLLASSLLLASATISMPADALVNISGQQTGGNVVFSYSGSLNITGLTTGAAIAGSTGIFPSVGNLAITAFDPSNSTRYVNAFSLQTFGTGNPTTSSSSSGNIFAIIGTNLIVSNTYVSNAAISGSSTFNGSTFANLGVTPGTYTYTLPNDSIVLNINATPVPFEFSPALGLGVIGGLVVAKKFSGKLLKK